jgi:phosphorylcholine metabolism protein LicD
MPKKNKKTKSKMKNKLANIGIFHAKHRFTSWKTLTLLIVFSALIVLWLSLDIYSSNIYANCTEKCIKQQKEQAENPPQRYYAEYEYGSKDYWNAYCNQMVGTKFECT